MKLLLLLFSAGILQFASAQSSTSYASFQTYFKAPSDYTTNSKWSNELYMCSPMSTQSCFLDCVEQNYTLYSNGHGKHYFVPDQFPIGGCGCPVFFLTDNDHIVSGESGKIQVQMEILPHSITVDFNDGNSLCSTVLIREQSFFDSSESLFWFFYLAVVIGVAVIAPAADLVTHYANGRSYCELWIIYFLNMIWIATSGGVVISNFMYMNFYAALIFPCCFARPFAPRMFKLALYVLLPFGRDIRKNNDLMEHPARFRAWVAWIFVAWSFILGHLAASLLTIVLFIIFGCLHCRMAFIMSTPFDYEVVYTSQIWTCFWNEPTPHVESGASPHRNGPAFEQEQPHQAELSQVPRTAGENEGTSPKKGKSVTTFAAP